MAPSDLTPRVIVGKKGSGKTVYLRRAQAYAVTAPELYADDTQQSLPTREQIAKVSRWFPAALLTETWMSIWKAAILRSLVTHLSYSKGLNPFVPTNWHDEIFQAYGRLLPDEPDPLSIYSQVSNIIRNATSARQLHRFLTEPGWEGIEYRIGEVIHSCPPICFYMDAVDEEFRHAPMYWLMCQKGLFYQVMRFLRDTRLGSRLHIVICIRDLVYGSVMQTEHLTRYINRRHIRVLEWTESSIQYLLREKLNRLDVAYFMGDPDKERTVGSWLGTRQVHNERKGVDERVERYLLRHTRLIPRDVIILGNMLHGPCDRGAASRQGFH